MRRLLALAAALASTLALAPSAAADTPTWTMAIARQPAGATSQRQLGNDLACPAAGACVLVGSYDGDVPEARLYIDTTSGGHVVSSIEAPLPSDALGPPYQTIQELTSVSCWAVGSCVAVGAYTDSADRTAGLIETLHNGSWTARRSPAGSGQNRSLDEVACNSAQCVATGTNLGASVVVRGADGVWQAQPVTTSATASTLRVEHPSCPPSGACYLTAVADFATTHDRALFAYPSGASWRGVYFPVPIFGVAEQLRVGRLSCPADGECVAFGSDQEEGTEHYRPVVERFANGELSVTTLPTPQGYGEQSTWYDEQVSCATVTHCAGFAYGGSGTVLYQLAGAGWTGAAAAAHGLVTYGVSCSTLGACVVAGADDEDGQDNPYLLTLTGAGWQPATLGFPRSMPAGDVGQLLAIRCVARTCVGIGNEGSSTTRFFSRTLIAFGRFLPTS